MPHDIITWNVLRKRLEGNMPKCKHSWSPGGRIMFFVFLLALYSVWYFPCSVKMHENYLVKKENRKVCVFQKILWLSYFIGTAQKKKHHISNKYSVKLAASQGGHASMKRKGEKGWSDGKTQTLTSDQPSLLFRSHFFLLKWRVTSVVSLIPDVLWFQFYSL